jgi:hypothetical protein
MLIRKPRESADFVTIGAWIAKGIARFFVGKLYADRKRAALKDSSYIEVLTQQAAFG